MRRKLISLGVVSGMFVLAAAFVWSEYLSHRIQSFADTMRLVPIGSSREQVRGHFARFSAASGYYSSGYAYSVSMPHLLYVKPESSPLIWGVLKFDDKGKLVEKRLTLRTQEIAIQIVEGQSTAPTGPDVSYLALSNGSRNSAQIFIAPQAPDAVKERLYKVRIHCLWPTNNCNTAQDFLPEVTLDDPI